MFFDECAFAHARYSNWHNHSYPLLRHLILCFDSQLTKLCLHKHGHSRRCLLLELSHPPQNRWQIPLRRLLLDWVSQLLDDLFPLFPDRVHNLWLTYLYGLG